MPLNSAPPTRRRLTLLLAIAFAVASGVAFLTIRNWNHEVADEKAYEGAANALRTGRWDDAERLGRELAQTHKYAREGLLIAGEASSRQGRPTDALSYFASIPDDGTRLARASLLAQAELFIDALPRLAAAETLYRRVLEITPVDLVANERLAYVLGLQGRSWEAIPHRMELIRQGRSVPIHMALLALGDAADENPESVAPFYQADPEDPAALCAMARLAIRKEHHAEARAWLTAALAKRPDLWRAQAWLGQVLLATNAMAEYATWEERLPAAANGYPEIWVVRGNAAAAAEQPRAAIRCFWEALLRDPNHQPATYGLGKALQATAETGLAEKFFARSKMLQQLLISVRTYQISQPPSAVEEACQWCEQLGLHWEAWGWYQILGRHRRLTPEEVERREQQLVAARESPGQRTDVTQRLAEQHDFSSFPLPTRRSSNAVAKTPIVPSNRHAAIQFADQAEQTGIKFTYFNGSRPETAGEYMYEFSGGSASVLDYDLDGQPDVYLSQGTDWPPREDNFKYLDCLYRRDRNGQYVEVAQLANIRENRFSQGVAVGDFDNDGFPDLYVANIGANRLYHNNGDGTFDDVTLAAQGSPGAVAGNDWTTSCLMADLNGDGLPDIYAVNYLTGETLFTRPCLMADGSPRLCTPHEFTAAQDRFYLNLGDGRFADVTSNSGIEVPDGKGLGIVAGDFDDSGRLSVFVANDTVPNFMFVNEITAAGAAPSFKERGFLTGVAVDADGHSQACMGVALGDSNGDGRLDIFVTNFRNESNTLYVQHEPLVFLDDTRRANLRAASFDMLGFGTQFLDADLDGREDLVVTNGHVGDLRAHGVAYQMPPQFFQNVGDGRYEELSAEKLGPFFAGKYLGRGLARLDFNNDGRPDFVVNHLSSRAALVANETPKVGHFLAVELHGTKSSRDAIGATLKIQAGGETHTQQLTAGDGYMASNQRRLLVGLGDHSQIERAEVKWPSGETTTLPPLAVDRVWIVVEGKNEAYSP